MRITIITICAALVACSAASVHAQQAAQAAQDPTERPVPLTQQAVALDARGAPALAARLGPTSLNGTPDSPVQDVQLIVENRSAFFYNYVSGWVTFYDAQGVRCGEGTFKIDALASGESAETDTPGLRITCAPGSWRIAATTLLTRTSDTAKPNEPKPNETPTFSQQAQPPASTSQPAAPNRTTLPPLRISIDGEDHPIQLNNPITIRVGAKQIKLILRTMP